MEEINRSSSPDSHEVIDLAPRAQKVANGGLDASVSNHVHVMFMVFRYGVMNRSEKAFIPGIINTTFFRDIKPRK